MTTRALDPLGQELAETEPLVSRKPSFSQRHPRLSLVVTSTGGNGCVMSEFKYGAAPSRTTLAIEDRAPSAKWQP